MAFYKCSDYFIRTSKKNLVYFFTNVWKIRGKKIKKIKKPIRKVYPNYYLHGTSSSPRF